MINQFKKYSKPAFVAVFHQPIESVYWLVALVFQNHNKKRVPKPTESGIYKRKQESKKERKKRNEKKKINENMLSTKKKKRKKTRT